MAGRAIISRRVLDVRLTFLYADATCRAERAGPTNGKWTAAVKSYALRYFEEVLSVIVVDGFGSSYYRHSLICEVCVWRERKPDAKNSAIFAAAARRVPDTITVPLNALTSARVLFMEKAKSQHDQA
jgi:hypothetical protein